MRHRPHIAGRLAVTLLVTMWVVRPVLEFAHAEAHAHRYCARHQTFEEGSGSGSVSPGASEALTQPELTDGTLAALDSAWLRHEACTCLATGTRLEPPSCDAPSVVAACLEVSRPATAPPAPFTALPLLATAPKASPPARA